MFGHWRGQDPLGRALWSGGGGGRTEGMGYTGVLLSQHWGILEC